MKKWQTLASNYVYQTPFGNLRQDRCKLPNGNIIENYYVNEFDDWVNAIVLTKERQVVLVEQYRHGANDFFLEVPAGKIEENETYEEAIIREVREETGYISATKPILLGEFFPNPAIQNNKVASFLIVDAFKAYDQQLDENEDVFVKIFSVNEIENMIANRKITQLFTVTAFHLAMQYMSNIFK